MIRQRFPDIKPVIRHFNRHMLKNPMERAYTSWVRVPPQNRLTTWVEKELVRLGTDLIIECQTHHDLERMQENVPHVSIICRLKLLTSFAISKYHAFAELLLKYPRGNRNCKVAAKIRICERKPFRFFFFFFLQKAQAVSTRGAS